MYASVEHMAHVEHVATFGRVTGWIAHSQQAMSLQPCVLEEVMPRNAMLWVVSEQPLKQVAALHRDIDCALVLYHHLALRT